jgi:hypothetical protein
MKDPVDKAQPLGKLLQLRLSEDEPEIEPPQANPILIILAFVGFLVIVAGLLTWFFE